VEEGLPAVRRLIAVLVAALVFPASAAAMPAFGVSNENPNIYRTIQKQMPVQIYAPFIAWKKANELNLVIAQARAFHSIPMISWESRDGSTGQTPPGMTDRDIIAGKQDAYIERQARYIKAFGSKVYLRFDHEMNGFWYPWSVGGPMYVRMWRHVWKIFRHEHAFNVRWVWSPNLWPYTDQQFDRITRSYWPGAKYVDIVGMTFSRGKLNGLATAESTAKRGDRLLVYHKPIWITEANVDLQEMRWWLPQFRAAIDRRPWIKAVVWLTSRHVAGNPNKWGDMKWLLTEQPFARHWLTWKRGYKP
jgi:beta-mannanase